MIGNGSFLSVYAALILASLFLGLHRDLGVPLKIPLDRFPCQVEHWGMESEEPLSREVLDVLRASDVLLRRYLNERGELVELYIGYHDGGKGSGEVHSPKHCLPGGGWERETSARLRIPVRGNWLNVVKEVYRKGEGRLLLYYWYQVGGKSLSGEYALKGAEIANSLLRGRREAALVRISVPFRGHEQQAAAVAESFLGDSLPVIRRFLPD